MRASHIVPVAALVLFVGCRLFEGAPARTVVDAATPREAGRDAGSPVEENAPPSFPRAACVHQRRADLGAPVHRERGGHGGFVRLDECTPVTLIEGDERWFRVSFPLTEDRTEGWISRQYVMDDCSPCAASDGGAGPPSTPNDGWPPRPRGMCLDAGATGQERLDVRDDLDQASVGGGARGVPGVSTVIVSYNVWELYDGDGGDRYLAGDAHGGTPATQYERRLSLLAKTLSAQEADMLLLQEVESAAVACELARRAWPASGWTCYATKGGGASPQNVAIASRLQGKAHWLHPHDRRAVGPRGAVELSLEGAGGLTVTAVHLKSSMGMHGADDCANARQRMGAAAALSKRYQGWSSVLVAGDFNVDPGDQGSALYDRTAEVLIGRGFKRICNEQSGCNVPTYAARTSSEQGAGSAVDLAFFRAGGRWRAASFRVLSTAPHRGRNELASDHLPIVVVLSRR